MMHGKFGDIQFRLKLSSWLFAEHAKSLVNLVKESDSVEQKSTMLQLVDIWRSHARKSGQPLVE